MKHIFIMFINVYQKIFSPSLELLLGTSNLCRFQVTCSQYAKTAIAKYGIMKGSYLAILRILSCQPFNKRALIHS